MPRYKLLTTIEDVVLSVAPDAPAGPEPTPTGKLDVDVAFAGYTEAGEFRFDVPPYSVDTHNVLDAVHVSLFERPADGGAPKVPVDLAEAVAGGLHYSTDTSTLQAGGPVVVDATEAPEGKYVAL